MKYFAAHSFGPGETSCKIIFERLVDSWRRQRAARESTVTQKPKQGAYERFPGPAPENLHFHFLHGPVRSPRQCFAQQGHEGSRFRQKLAAGRDSSCPGQHNHIRVYLAWDRLLAHLFCGLHACSHLGGLSYVQPASSFSYAVVAMLGYFLLGEAVPPLRWMGIFVICVGVFIVGQTHPRTTEKT